MDSRTINRGGNKGEAKNRTYQCSHCVKSYKFSCELESHAMTHSILRPFSCRTCGKTFKTKSQFSNHELVHSTGKFPCSECGRLLRSLGALNYHVKCLHSGNSKTFSCTQCSTSYGRLSDLSKHIQTLHDPNYSFSVKCAVCDKVFPGNYQLQIHMRSHTNERPHFCSVCRKAFSTPIGLKSHLERIHAEVKVKPFSCIICEKPFYTSGDVMNHVHSHTKETPYSCKICGKESGKKSNARKHLRHHSIKKPFPCADCTLSYNTNLQLIKHVYTAHGKVLHHNEISLGNNNTTKLIPKRKQKERRHDCTVCHKLVYNLKEHMYIHTGERPFKCKLCRASFCSKSSLKVHNKIHEDQKMYSCSECSSTFVGMRGLFRHLRAVHERVTKSKNIKCKLCHKLFYWKSSLDNHMKVHSEEKPVQCVMCEKGFRTTSNLYSHIHFVHLGNEKPYYCKKCHLSFSVAFFLKQHVRKVHLKPVFECIICNKVFSANYALLDHTRVHLGEKPYSCVQCGLKFKWNSGLTNHSKTHK